MKRILILMFVTAIILSLISCNTSDSVNDLEVKISLESDEVTEIESTDTTEEFSEEVLSKTRLTDAIETENSVVYELENAYYNEYGGIVIEGYIVNVTDHVADIVKCRKLELYNADDELIASESFGYVKESYGWICVDVGEKFERSFIFPAITVHVEDANLDGLKVVSSFVSKHTE